MTDRNPIQGYVPKRDHARYAQAFLSVARAVCPECGTSFSGSFCPACDSIREMRQGPTDPEEGQR